MYEFPEQLTIEESTHFSSRSTVSGVLSVWGRCRDRKSRGPQPDLNLCGNSMPALGIYIASQCREPGKILQTRFLLVIFALSGRSGGGGWGAMEGWSGGRRHESLSVADRETEAE